MDASYATPTRRGSVLNSHVFHSRASHDGARSETAVLFHHGHEAQANELPGVKARTKWWNKVMDYHNISQFIHDRLRCDSFLLYMPLVGHNMATGWKSYHTEFEKVQQLTGQDGLRFFLEPIHLTINHALSLGYARIVLMGLSGGGWATTLAAAIDPRIDVSIPVAGSTPLGTGRKDDYEQRPQPKNPNWYLSLAKDYAPKEPRVRLQPWARLYALAVLEKPRVMLQIVHQDDPCCFAARGHHGALLAYADNISAALKLETSHADEVCQAQSVEGAHGSFSVTATQAGFHAVTPQDRAAIEAGLRPLLSGSSRGSNRQQLWNLPCDLLNHRAHQLQTRGSLGVLGCHGPKLPGRDAAPPPACRCTDVVGWRNVNDQDCAWYARDSDTRCYNVGIFRDMRDGMAATSACCVCGGGIVHYHDRQGRHFVASDMAGVRNNISKPSPKVLSAATENPTLLQYVKDLEAMVGVIVPS